MRVLTCVTGLFCAGMILEAGAAIAASAESLNGTTAGSVATTASAVRPLQAGMQVPDVALRDPAGSDLRLAEALSSQPAVLIFFRGGWCPYCTRHLSELAAVEPKLRAAGVRIVAITPDRPERLRDRETSSSFVLLSDSDVEAAKAFGLAYQLPEETVQRYLTFKNKIDLEEWSGRSHHVLPVPAVFVVDAAGIIRFAHWEADYRKRLSGEEVLQAALKHARVP